jgi:hypothetical protein
MAAKESDGQLSQIPQSMWLLTSSNRLVSYMFGGWTYSSQVASNVQKQSCIAFHCDQVGDFSFSKDMIVKISRMRPKCV